MARKSEVQKKDEHENRNAVIVGFLLAIIPFFLFLVALVSGPTCLSPSYSSCGETQSVSAQRQAAGNGNITEMATCIGTALCTPKIILYGMFPTFYTFVCLPLGALLYILSVRIVRLDTRIKSRLKFWGKSIFVGGVMGIAITMFIIPSLVGLLL